MCRLPNEITMKLIELLVFLSKLNNINWRRIQEKKNCSKNKAGKMFIVVGFQ